MPAPRGHFFHHQMPAPAPHRPWPPRGPSARRVPAWLLAGLLLLLAALPGAARAQDLVRDRAYLEDAAGTLGVDEARAGAFQPVGYLLNEGPTRSVVWLRLVLAEQAQAGPVWLHLSPSALDEVRLYALFTASGARLGPVNLAARAAQARTRLDLPAGRTVLYLRLQTSGLMMASAQVLAAEDTERLQRHQGHFQGGLTVFVLAAAAFCFWTFYKTREAVYLAFGLNILVILLQVFTHFDLLSGLPGLDDATSKALTRVSNLANACMGAITMLVFAQRFRFWPAVIWLARAVALAQVAVLAGYLLSGLQQPWMVGFVLGTVYTLCFQAALAVYCLSRHLNLASAALMGVFVLVYAGMAASLLGHHQPHGVSRFSEIDIFVLRALLIPVFMAWLFMILEADRAAAQARLSAARNDALVLAGLETRRRQAQSYLLSMLTHELRSPLATIQLASATLSRGVADGTPDQQRLQHIDKSVDDIHYVLGRCVEVEQDVDHHLVPQIAPVSIGQLLQDVADAVADPVAARRLVWQQDGEDQLASDRQFLRIILANLVGNALKYSPAQTVVQLQASRSGDGSAGAVCFSVRSQVGDAGVPDAAQVFGRYYRAEGARKQAGAGLGLWLSQNLAAKLGTAIGMQVAGGDIVFSFELGAAA